MNQYSISGIIQLVAQMNMAQVTMCQHYVTQFNLWHGVSVILTRS